MLNHVLRFGDEATALLALAEFAIDTGDGLAWDASRVIPGQRVVLARAVWDWSDPENPVETSPEVALPGYFMTVSLEEMSEDLLALPDYACRLVGDAATGQILYAAPDVDPDILAQAIIEPVPAGSAYLFLA